MTNIRLIGLMLFITAIALALAAAATRTTHVRISDPWGIMPELPAEAESEAPARDDLEHDRHAGHPVVSFTSVPIYWPLVALSVLGLGLWFIQPTNSQRASSQKRSQRSRQAQTNRRRKERK